MSVKSDYEKSTEIKTTENLQINESLLNKINKILEIVLEENKTLKNYNEKWNKIQQNKYNKRHK